MSTGDIPYPHDFDVDYHADRHEERRRRALKALDVGDILSVIDDLIAAEPDPANHPCFGLVNWLLDRQLSVDGGAFWDAWKRLAHDAIDRLVAQRLQMED
jgi:hypothetical protein